MELSQEITELMVRFAAHFSPEKVFIKGKTNDYQIMVETERGILNPIDCSILTDSKYLSSKGFRLGFVDSETNANVTIFAYIQI